MEAKYLKCHHGNLVRDCRECETEKQQMKSIIYNAVKEQEKDKRIPIYRGCSNGTCFCTGRCRDIIGYYE